MQRSTRFYEIAGITLRVESDLPFTEATFDRKFSAFQVAGPGGPGSDTVVIRHHFGLPEAIPGRDTAAPAGTAIREVYRKPPWAIFRAGDSWVYHGIARDPDDHSLHQVAVFSADHSRGDIYSSEAYRQAWLDGGLHALTMFPSDQILLARLVADRQGCYLHSAGLAIDGRGFVFVGHSEAGKSTTVGLVRAGFGDRAETLCDDRTIVRHWSEGFRGGPPGFYVHGTWSHGDVPDVSSTGAPLRAVLFLEQHELNEIVPLSDRREIWQRLLVTVIKPMVTVDWWDKEMDVLESIAGDVPCYIMRFDKSGAVVDQLEKLAR